jgi:hypothetical protein
VKGIGLSANVPLVNATLFQQKVYISESAKISTGANWENLDASPAAKRQNKSRKSNAAGKVFLTSPNRHAKTQKNGPLDAKNHERQ